MAPFTGLKYISRQILPKEMLPKVCNSRFSRKFTSLSTTESSWSLAFRALPVFPLDAGERNETRPRLLVNRETILWRSLCRTMSVTIPVILSIGIFSLYYVINCGQTCIQDTCQDRNSIFSVEAVPVNAWHPCMEAQPFPIA